ncbi:MAG: phosphoesterase [Pirellulaceae bacterium]|jgi:predicted NUDIX family phosphoesterase
MAKDEQVLCVPESHLLQLGAFSGFLPINDQARLLVLDRSSQSFLPRSQCETDPRFKQLIPYVLFTYANPKGEIEVFRYTRGSGQGEARLHALQSIGIGGHISTEDTSGDHWYESGMRREVTEELHWVGAAGQTDPWESLLSAQAMAGLIYDDQSEVGRVHLGVVHHIHLTGPWVAAREDQMIDSGFVPLEQLRRERSRLETWSQLCLDRCIHSWLERHAEGA